MNSRKKQKKRKKLKNKLKKKKSTYLGNLFLYLFVLLTIPLFGEGAINALQSGVSWVDEKVFNRTVENLEVEKSDDDGGILERAAKEVDKEVNEEINEEIDKIGNDD